MTGPKLTDTEEVLLRQIHPHFYENQKLGSPAFMPNPNDNNLVSSDRASRTSAAEAYYHYTNHAGRASACVFGVTVGEYEEESITCFEDPMPAAETIPANPSHCVSDYSSHEAKKQKLVAKRLKAKAEQRGRLHP